MTKGDSMMEQQLASRDLMVPGVKPEKIRNFLKKRQNDNNNNNNNNLQEWFREAYKIL